MDKILLILGDQTSDIRRNLDKNFSESVTVIDSFNTPQEFAEAYDKTTLRANRIIIHSSSLAINPHAQIELFKSILDNFYIQFEQCYFLVEKGSEVETLYDFLVNDQTFLKRNTLRLYVHETFTPGLVTNYCLNKIPKTHFVKDDIEYNNIIRVRKNDNATFKLFDEEDEDKDSTKIVLMDSDTVTPIEIQEKLKNVMSSANQVAGEKWENNKILKDLMRLESLTDVAFKNEKYEIDYSRFYTNNKIVKKDKNIYVVSGEKRSGKSTLAYALSKSAVADGDKVLLLDFAINDFGLSYLAENQSDLATVIRIQDFKNDFESALQTLVNSRTKLNMVALNANSESDLDGISAFPLLTLVATTSQKYFDCVIIDINLEDLDSAISVVSSAKKLIFTVPAIITSIYSLFKHINEESLITLFPNTEKVLVPTSLFAPISKNMYINGNIARALTKEVYGNDMGVISKVKFNSLDVTNALKQTIDSI